MAELRDWKKVGLFVPYYGRQWAAESDQDAYNEIMEYISALPYHLEDGKGLLLMGGPGRGKTLLAHLACDAVLDMRQRLGVSTHNLLIALTVQGYLDLFRQSMNAIDIIRKTGDSDASGLYMRAEESIQAIMTKIKVAFLDDIGKEHTTATGYAQHQIERLIRARGNRGLPTIITSNLDIDGLAEQYGESFSSYLLQACLPIYVGGEDHRSRSVKG